MSSTKQQNTNFGPLTFNSKIYNLIIQQPLGNLTDKQQSTTNKLIQLIPYPPFPFTFS